MDYRLAGLATRALAWGFDALLQSAAVCLLLAALAMGGFVVALGLMGDDALLVALALAILAIFVIVNAYFIYFELRWHGQSPGKRIMHLRVLKEGGHALEFRDSLVRNLLRVVDWLPSFYGVGAVSTLFGRSARRLGDHAAGTYVIHEEPPLPPEATAVPPARRYIPEALRLGEARLDLIRLFFRRAPFLDRRNRVRLAEGMADRFLRELGLPRESSRSSEGYLADLLHSAMGTAPG